MAHTNRRSRSQKAAFLHSCFPFLTGKERRQKQLFTSAKCRDWKITLIEFELHHHHHHQLLLFSFFFSLVSSRFGISAYCLPRKPLRVKWLKKEKDKVWFRIVRPGGEGNSRFGKRQRLSAKLTWPRASLWLALEFFFLNLIVFWPLDLYTSLSFTLYHTIFHFFLKY